MDRRVDEIARLYESRYIGFRNALATVTRDYDLARDAVQEAFAVALRERDHLRSEESLAAWVWKIAYRDALRRTRVSSGSREGAIADAPAELPESCDDVALRDAIRRLPPRRRLIVFLRYFADLSYPEIAEACDIEVGTVSATLAQARAELRATMEGAAECR